MKASMTVKYRCLCGAPLPVLTTDGGIVHCGKCGWPIPGARRPYHSGSSGATPRQIFFMWAGGSGFLILVIAVMLWVK